MKYYRNLLLILMTVIGILSCNFSKEKIEFGKATKELITLLDNNPELKLMLKSSIKKVKRDKPGQRHQPSSEP